MWIAGLPWSEIREVLAQARLALAQLRPQMGSAMGLQYSLSLLWLADSVL